MKFLWLVLIALILGILTLADALSQRPAMHSESWAKVPNLIQSLDGPAYLTNLEALAGITHVQLGAPLYREFSEADQDAQKKVLILRWNDWWEKSGKWIEQQTASSAMVDEKAFGAAWEFLASEKPILKKVAPVWIPGEWTLFITYTNGDYFGREKELWVIERRKDIVNFSKLRGEYRVNSWRLDESPWGVSLKSIATISVDQADRLLRTLIYIHHYSYCADQDSEFDDMPGTYYPRATCRLEDGSGKLIWNKQGYTFQKSPTRYSSAFAGRACYYLRTAFADEKLWVDLDEPTSDQLAPYRRYLLNGKPYFSSLAAEVMLAFAYCGREVERDTVWQWIEQQKLATNRDLSWQVCWHDFDSGMAVNVRNRTRLDLKMSRRVFERINQRITDNDPEKRLFYSTRLEELNAFVDALKNTEATEKEDKLSRFPQPLQKLMRIKAKSDPDLKLLSTHVQAIRFDPDPNLFRQIVKELDDGTMVMKGLLERILINDLGLLKIEPWDKKQQDVAVEACIDAMSIVEDSAMDDLLVILLRVCGGGKIEIVHGTVNTSVTVELRSNGYFTTLGGAQRDCSLVEAQANLRKLYRESFF